MTTTYNLTANELRAAMILVKSCLDGMGGQRPADLENDEYTWVAAGDLVGRGYSVPEANGTFGALMTKGLVYEYDRNEWVLATEAWQWLETQWDAYHEPTDPEGPKGGDKAPVDRGQDATAEQLITQSDVTWEEVEAAFPGAMDAEREEAESEGYAPTRYCLPGPDGDRWFTATLPEEPVEPARVLTEAAHARVGLVGLEERRGAWRIPSDDERAEEAAWDMGQGIEVYRHSWRPGVLGAEPQVVTMDWDRLQTLAKRSLGRLTVRGVLKSLIEDRTVHTWAFSYTLVPESTLRSAAA